MLNRKLELSQYDILSKLYVSTNGNNWISKLNWMNGIDPCPYGGWYGIDCDNENPYGFFLQNNNLYGTLPAELGLLTLMVAFAVHGNSVSGTIPSELGAFTGLTSSFRFRENMMSGSLPSQLGQLTLCDNRFDFNSNCF